MMETNSDKLNNLLNQLAYINFDNKYEPGVNLITALKANGAEDLADALKAAGYGNYVIKDYVNQNDANGFAAVAIEDPATGDVGISYRGTENLTDLGESVSSILSGDFDKAVNQQIDMIDNISSAVSGNSSQVQDALDFFQRNQSSTGDNYLYGHSKGGELALEVYVANHQKIEQIHVINPQPINWTKLTAEQRAALQNGKLDATVINGDLVWLLGGVPYPVRIIQNNGRGNGLWDPHDLQSAAYNEDGSAKIELSPYGSYTIQGLLGGGLNVLITVVQAGHFAALWLLDLVGDLCNFLIDESIEHAQKLWDSIQNAWQKTKDYVQDVRENVEGFFSNLMDSAKNWWEDLFDGDESKPSGSGSGFCRVRVDPQRLQQEATQMQQIARELEQLANTINDCRRSLKSSSFVANVMIQTSLLNTRNKISDLSNSAASLTKVLTNVSQKYEQTEQQVLYLA